jgi:ABC-type transporter Mla subunit MlaD
MKVNENNIIDIQFSVVKTFSHRIHNDARVMFSRGSIFGEKHIDLLPGSKSQPVLIEGAFIKGRDATGLSDFITGNKLNVLMTDIEDIIRSTKKMALLIENFATEDKIGDHAKSAALIYPALNNFVALSNDLVELTEKVKKRDTDFPEMVEHGSKMVTSLNKDFIESGVAQSALSSIDRVMGPIADRQLLVEQLLGNLESLSATLSKNPDYGDKLLDTLNEMTLTMKALQRTWILSDHAEDIKKTDSQPSH